MESPEQHHPRGDELAETAPMPEEEVRPDGPRGKDLAETEPVPERDVQPGGERGEGLAGDS